MSKEDFASLMEASVKAGRGTGRRLKHGEVVEGTVVQVSGDSVFIDVGATKEARVPKSELEDRDGNVRVQVGDRLRATVVDLSEDIPVLAIALGRSGIDLAGLQTALETGTPVAGKVTKAVKGGLEVDVGGVRAFCPASQVEIGYAADLAPYEGQSFEFKVLELKDGGRSVVLSRRALLEVERRARADALGETLVVGSDMEGSVASVSRHGAIVDVGGIDGFVHISELAHRRIDRVEDVVNVGDRVAVRVLAVEQGDKGLRVRLSMKVRLDAPEAPAVQVDEVLDAVVVKAIGGGVIVSTAKGEGMVPVSELGLPPGSDHRRTFPVGRAFQVVVVQRDVARGRLRFSLVGVARVEERKNYRDFGGGRRCFAGESGRRDAQEARLAGRPAGSPHAAVGADRGRAGARGPSAHASRRRRSAAATPPPAAPTPGMAAMMGRPAAERRPDPEGVVRRKR